MSDDVKTGTIKKVTEKGFGFIAQGDGPDVFFHISAVSPESSKMFDAFQPGDPVTFKLVNGEKGPKAENVVYAMAA